MSSVLDYDRFRLVWRCCLLVEATDESVEIHRQLIECYSEPQRFYHTLVHIEHCLSLLDIVKPRLQNPEALELAIWFHDVVYQPGATDNEQLSADQFMSLTSGVFDDSLRDTVSRHIMATLHVESDIENLDTKYMVDIDLSSFGLPWPEFIRDSDNLRQEMAHLTNEDYYRKQTVFQKTLIDRPRFFKSDYFYQRYETQARENLAKYFKDIPIKL